MKKCTAFVAAFLILPLLALGAEVDADSGIAAAGTPRMTSSSQYHCCWIFWMGRWTCMPC
jgi:hypothetical protein